MTQTLIVDHGLTIWLIESTVGKHLQIGQGTHASTDSSIQNNCRKSRIDRV